MSRAAILAAFVAYRAALNAAPSRYAGLLLAARGVVGPEDRLVAEYYERGINEVEDERARARYIQAYSGDDPGVLILGRGSNRGLPTYAVLLYKSERVGRDVVDKTDPPLIVVGQHHTVASVIRCDVIGRELRLGDVVALHYQDGRLRYLEIVVGTRKGYTALVTTKVHKDEAFTASRESLASLFAAAAESPPPVNEVLEAA